MSLNKSVWLICRLAVPWGRGTSTWEHFVTDQSRESRVTLYRTSTTETIPRSITTPPTPDFSSGWSFSTRFVCWKGQPPFEDAQALLCFYLSNITDIKYKTILHRDSKPVNIYRRFVACRGRVWLINLFILKRKIRGILALFILVTYYIMTRS